MASTYINEKLITQIESLVATNPRINDRAICDILGISTRTFLRWSQNLKNVYDLWECSDCKINYSKHGVEGDKKTPKNELCAKCKKPLKKKPKLGTRLRRIREKSKLKLIAQVRKAGQEPKHWKASLELLERLYPDEFGKQIKIVGLDDLYIERVGQSFIKIMQVFNKYIPDDKKEQALLELKEATVDIDSEMKRVQDKCSRVGQVSKEQRREPRGDYGQL